MPEEHDRRERIGRGRRTRSERASATLALAVAGVSLIVLALPGAQASGTAPAAGTLPADAPEPSLAGLLGLPDEFELVPEELPGRVAEFQWHFAVAALPTATPVPPTPTATVVPPTPTAVVHRPAVQQAPPSRPAPPPPPPPTATPAPQRPPAGQGLDLSPMNAQEQGLFNAINARRATQGMGPLRANIYLTGVGRIRSQDMADHDYFAHTSPITGDDAFSLMTTYGVPYAWAGENLALNNYALGECAQVADQALWDSPPHRANALGEHYTDMGVALRTSADGKHYFTVIFTGP
jgi:uncharacterized protein YkwD